MTVHRLLNAAIGLAIFVGASVILLAGPILDDHRADWPESTALRDAQKQAQAEARSERAAAQLCIKIAGPGVAPVWDTDGRLVCRARKGGAKTTVVAGGQL